MVVEDRTTNANKQGKVKVTHRDVIAMGIMNKLSKQTQNSREMATAWLNQYFSKENGLGKAKV